MRRGAVRRYHAAQQIKQLLKPPIDNAYSRSKLLACRAYACEIRLCSVDELWPSRLPSSSCSELRVQADCFYPNERIHNDHCEDSAFELWPFRPPERRCSSEFVWSPAAAEFIPQQVDIVLTELSLTQSSTKRPRFDSQEESFSSFWNEMEVYAGLSITRTWCVFEEDVEIWSKIEAHSNVFNPQATLLFPSIQHATSERFEEERAPFWEEMETEYSRPVPREWSCYEDVNWLQVETKMDFWQQSVLNGSSPPRCQRCQVARLAIDANPTDCICENTWCKTCTKQSCHCQCLVPAIVQMFCPECGHRIDADGRINVDATALTCSQCSEACMELCTNWIDDSGAFCATCHGYLDYAAKTPCDGRGCSWSQDIRGALFFHAACMTVVSAPNYDEGAHLCSRCIALGAHPMQESDSSNLFDSEEDEEEESPSESSR
jgi:hypothetical protein